MLKTTSPMHRKQKEADIGEISPSGTPPKKTAIAIALKTGMLRESMAEILKNAGFDVLAADPGTEQAVSLLADHSPDVTIADWQSVKLCQDLKEQTQTKIILLAEVLSRELILNCAEAEADGCFLSEHGTIEKLQATIKNALVGNLSYSSEAWKIIFELLVLTKNMPEKSPLTERELEIGRMLTAEPALADKQLARKLGVSRFTVKNHMHSLLKKTGLKSRRQIPDYCRAHRLI